MTDYFVLVEAETARLAELASAIAPETPVPTCPGWTFADLITHVGTMHRWVTHMVSTRNQQPIWSRQVPNGLADGESGDQKWLAAGMTEMLGTLRATDPDTAMWTWGPSGRASWWPRRMAHELVVHRADAELALGREPLLGTAVAADGIEEFLENLPAAFWVTRHLAELDVAGATFHLHATDGPGEWTFAQGSDGGISWERGHVKGDVAVRAPAGELLLMLYGRRSPDGLTVHGDRALLERWLESANL
ncbi:maleylpyruvate isomerase family mycothiol-dependent enzyme [Nonomuraea sp. LPB2021202275-12-8]|uniref:maleylpyruvate isomerase family mycothiol-dependent enzyme n=1 Tax=Nonomuraea sp. LPB2021202275-12-8 TaxID=3120159 RepID=UPI00300D7332